MGTRRLFINEQVREFSSVLEAISAETLRQRYDTREMTELEIYPEIIWERDQEDALDYLLGTFERLRKFIRETVQLNQGVIVIFT